MKNHNQKRKFVAFGIFAIAILVLPMFAQLTDSVSDLTQLALNHTKNPDPIAQDIVQGMEFGIGALAALSILCGIQAIALGVPVL